MPGVFVRQDTYHAGSFASDTAVLAIAGSTTALGIVQNANITFNQNVSRVYDVGNGGRTGTVPVWYVGGRTQGNATIGRIIGPAVGGVCKFYKEFGNVCAPVDLTFAFQAGCAKIGTQAAAGIAAGIAGGIGAVAGALGLGGGGAGVAGVVYKMTGTLLTQIGITVNSNDMIINENAQFMFANLDCSP